MVEFTRKEYNIIAKNRCIIETENIFTQDLINTLSRYDSKRKVKSNRRQLSKIGLEKIAENRIFQKMN